MITQSTDIYICTFLHREVLVIPPQPTWGPSGADSTQVDPMLAPCYLDATFMASTIGPCATEFAITNASKEYLKTPEMN